MKTVFGSENCHKCKEKCKEFDEAGVPYKYVDVDTLTQDQIRELVSLTGKTSLPIITEE